MDITPKPAISREPASVRTPSPDQPIVSDLNALKLKTGEVYEARVQQKSKAQETPIQEQAKLEQAKQTIDDTQKTKKATEWLLNINGKLLKVATEIPLQAGQQLQLKLASTQNNATKALLIINAAPEAPLTSKASSENVANLSVLLSSLSKLLPKQVSLDVGFSLLSELNKAAKPSDQNSPATPSSKTSNTNLLPPNPLTQKTIEHLLKNLTSAEEIIQTNQSAKPAASAELMRQTLSSSGVFLESSLASPVKIQHLNTQLQQLQRMLLDTVDSQAVKAPNNDPRQTTAPKEGLNSPTSAKTTSKQAFALFQQLMQQGGISKTSPDSQKTALPTTTITTPSTGTPDLKSTLIALSSLLNKQQSAHASPQPLQALLSELLQPELLATPFNFPRASIDTAAKAKALFSEQEFSTGQLLKLLGGMLNRIQFNQLNSVYQTQGSEGSALQSWFIELPLVNINQQVNTFNLRIDKEQDPHSNSGEEEDKKSLQWKLLLSFDLEELGPIYIQVSLLPPSISSIIWADRSETYMLAQQEIKHFKSKLNELGLEVGDIICQKGLPPQQATKLSQSLVDIKA